MQTWIFQGNPDEFDLDGYLASRPGQVPWACDPLRFGDRGRRPRLLVAEPRDAACRRWRGSRRASWPPRQRCAM